MIQEPLLSIVGTPIGNLKDISERVRQALSKADIVFAEDTSTALSLFNHLGLKKKVLSCHKDNEKIMIPKILSEVDEDKYCVIISEAGMPCISDPGSMVVRELIKNNVPFDVISGPTALIHGLILSGFAGGPFHFIGFPPHKPTEKKKLFDNLKTINTPIIFYESPYRVKETVELLLEYFPAPISVSREITKIHEETVFIHTKEDIENIKEKGEFVLVVNNVAEENDEKNNNIQIDFNKIIENLRKDNFTSQDIVKILKTLGMKRNEAYKMLMP